MLMTSLTYPDIRASSRSRSGRCVRSLSRCCNAVGASVVMSRCRYVILLELSRCESSIRRFSSVCATALAYDRHSYQERRKI